MTNKRVALSFAFVLLLTLTLFSHFVIAQAPPVAPTASGTADEEDTQNILEGASFLSSLGLKEKWDLWLKGGDLGALGNTVKILFLLIVILLIYSSLAYAKFPESTIMQIILAVVVGLMATFLITTNELLTVLQSYKALGITLSVFLPIMILTFFTMVVSSKASPIGIFSQKIAWVIYSAYLFLKTIGIIWLMQVAKVGADGKIIWATASNKMPAYLALLLTKNTENLKQIMSSNDSLISIVLLITSIAVFVIMVLGNKIVLAWLAKERINAEVETQKQMIERSHAYDKARAESMQKGQ